ncbi:HD domain-containing protein [Ornithinibacillus halophilus]|uniref:HD/PDEase domain-containing protein n=1 Tax=Ornithinibacillus halophilus TaxID=930117 RepID=A0A1M5CL35_9BACI|nr:HD domain-containing protein [Ornithinibacillus halophilus]SHF55411.1 uncharacterized protein SAMN05216225_1001294 [Ornithinibacillus halophilus]
MQDQDLQLTAIQDYVRDIFSNDVTGHDYFHLKRVVRLSKEIAISEKADPFICEIVAWLHDVGDKKLFSNPNKAVDDMNQMLSSIKLSNHIIEEINHTIQDISFKKGSVPDTLEGKVVQDADRLDAIGAIGIARTFAYGGAKGQLINHDNLKESTSIQHFYDKLLRLMDTMNTSTAKNIAKERHQFLERFLEQFYKEWNYIE